VLHCTLRVARLASSPGVDQAAVGIGSSLVGFLVYKILVLRVLCVWLAPKGLASKLSKPKPWALAVLD